MHSIPPVTCCVTCPYLANTYLDIPGCAKSVLLAAIKNDLLFITRSLLFSCLLSTLWHIDTPPSFNLGQLFLINLLYQKQSSVGSLSESDTVYAVENSSRKGIRDGKINQAMNVTTFWSGRSQMRR